MQTAFYAVPGAQPAKRTTVALVVSALIVVAAAVYGSVLLLNATSLQNATRNPQRVTYPIDEFARTLHIDAYPPADGQLCDPDGPLDELDPARLVEAPMPTAYTVGPMSCSFAATISAELLPQLAEAVQMHSANSATTDSASNMPTGTPQANSAADDATATGETQPEENVPESPGQPSGAGAVSTVNSDAQGALATHRVVYAHQGASVSQQLYDQQRARMVFVTCSLLEPAAPATSPVACTSPLGYGVAFAQLPKG